MTPLFLLRLLTLSLLQSSLEVLGYLMHQFSLLIPVEDPNLTQLVEQLLEPLR
jgi:hypothetical protein